MIVASKKDTIQKTLKRTVSLSGKGLFTGSNVTLTLRPNFEKNGIVFKRVDLPGSPTIPAKLDYVKETPRCTILGNKQASIQTVEHLLSALSAMQVDHLIIEIDGPELPACDGSSLPFIKIIEDAEMELLDSLREYAVLDAPIYWTYGDTHIIGLPSSEFKVSYTLHYPHSSFLRSQFFSYKVDTESYKTEIAPCRTFSLYEEIEPMLKKGLLKGGGLDNGVVIKDNQVLNPGGLRFLDEMARHKILDLLGDLSLIGKPILGHIIAIRSGHYSNVAFAKELNKRITEIPK
ncbi:MAG: UDP-3-O-[3-hydroxymyristoyl] N-acetylglucosamine deacetylase [Chlamydiae bacterium CG10_big_fil_rev_8_21_14_0_10_35_9]|nr:MAG: UDP-3-O-[3-hydroxymyristoyl] N-acetylglucosamine deacetylase [Chlamydiae bacterium CG10_big_fil_rev_8_21_14_0_10_35_9]